MGVVEDTANRNRLAKLLRVRFCMAPHPLLSVTSSTSPARMLAD